MWIFLLLLRFWFKHPIILSYGKASHQDHLTTTTGLTGADEENADKELARE
jgi:hypothetical protein